jgi:hypothetical protein
MPYQELKCPFCPKTSSRGTGLASHIRFAHPKQYRKWAKDPNRLQATPKLGSPDTPNRPASPPRLGQTEPTQTIQTEQIAPGNPTLQLLTDTLSQLQRRKQTVEKELARFDDLRKELEAASAEIESLEKTLGLFESQPTADSSRGSRSR